jgi:hypothetical protein
MAALIRLRPWLIAVAVAATAHLLNASDWVSAMAGMLAGVASWHPPPRSSDRAVERRPIGPAVDVGEVVQARELPALLLPGQRFLLELAELDRHVAVIGTTGSGKTTTLTRLVDTALLERWPVLLVDAKGGRLADTSLAVAQRRGVGSRLWLPGHPATWTYDICAGDPIAVGNRLVGAFEFGFEAQVYRNLAQSILPLVIQGLLSAGVVCDLDTLRFSLDRAHLTGLVRRLPDSQLKSELMTLREDELHRNTLSGLVGRLRALRFGLFGQWLLPSERTLDLAASLVEPGLTYLGLPATAASEDVALVGRVLVQHLKQVAYEALWSSERRPALIVFDEFVSLREAAQLVDLLLQAREARLAVVVSSQHVPRDYPLRHSVLSAGTLIVHQIGSPDDADILARALGSRSGPEVALQLVLSREERFHRRVLRSSKHLLIPADDLARLPVGQAAVAVRFGEQRLGLVQVDPLRIT